MNKKILTILLLALGISGVASADSVSNDDLFAVYHGPSYRFNPDPKPYPQPNVSNLAYLLALIESPEVHDFFEKSHRKLQRKEKRRRARKRNSKSARP